MLIVEDLIDDLLSGVAHDLPTMVPSTDLSDHEYKLAAAAGAMLVDEHGFAWVDPEFLRLLRSPPELD